MRILFELQVECDAAQRETAIAWGRNPANADAYAGMVADANERWKGHLKSPFGQRSRDVDVLLACATRCGFVSLMRTSE